MMDPPKPEPNTTNWQDSVRTGAFHARGHLLRIVHLEKAVEAGGGALWTAAEAFGVPCVGKGEAGLLTEGEFQSEFECLYRGFLKFAECLQSIECSVAGAGWDETNDIGTGVEGRVDGSFEPSGLFVLGDEGDANQEEGSHGDAVVPQEGCSGLEVGGGDAFVDLLEGFGVAGLQPHRNFQVAVDHAGELQHAFVHEAWVALDD